MRLNAGGTGYEACRVFCVGMNYVAHIHELKNEIPATPVIFMKPATSLVGPGVKLVPPTHGHDLHYETEVVVLIGREGRPRTPAEARAFIAGLTLGLDLTLRDVQTALREKGLPWEFCKAFEGSAPVGDFSPPTEELDLGDLTFTGAVNDRIRQRGHTANMVFPITTLILELAKVWTLRPGDVLYTGTPEGVGALHRGDRLSVSAPWAGSFSWTVE